MSSNIETLFCFILAAIILYFVYTVYIYTERRAAINKWRFRREWDEIKEQVEWGFYNGLDRDDTVIRVLEVVFWNRYRHYDGWSDYLIDEMTYVTDYMLGVLRSELVEYNKEEDKNGNANKKER